MKVYLFTLYFTFTEVNEIFLAEELYTVSGLEDLELVLVPFKQKREIAQPLPRNVSVNRTLLDRVAAFSFRHIYRFLIRRSFWAFCMELLRYYLLRFRLPPYILLARYVRAEFIADFLVKEAILKENTVLYSYWFDEALAGFSLATTRRPELSSCLRVARAHGYDFRSPVHSFPFRRKSFFALDWLCCASRYAKQTIDGQYPELRERSFFTPLGVKDFSSIEKIQTADYQFVSCSNLVALKRIGLIFDFINAFAKAHPNASVVWTHFGDGEERAHLEKKIATLRVSNLTVSLKGTQANLVIRHYLASLEKALMINLSETEGGIPVSLQEALSASLPLIVTAVGGNPEAGDEGAGVLLSSQPTELEFITAAEQIFANYADYAKDARQKYMTYFQSTPNFMFFYKNLYLWSVKKGDLTPEC